MSRSLATALLELKEDARQERAHDEELRHTLEEIEQDLPLKPLSPRPVEWIQGERTAYDLLDEVGASLAVDAQDFLAALFWLMTAAGYSEKARSFVVCIFAYTDRNCTDEGGVEITDPKLAEFMNCCERTIQRGRKAYKDEMIEVARYDEHKSFRCPRLPIISIDEGEYDKSREQNRPTRYRFEVAHLVADAVLEARQSKLWESDYRAALKKAAYHVYDAERIAHNHQFPTALRRRRKRTLSPDAERGRILKTIKTGIERLSEIESHMEGDFSPEWEAFKREIDHLYYGSTNRVSPQATDKKEHNPMGRQSVAPSIPDVVVSKDVPSSAPASEYWRVPSIARAMKENGERPPH
ncbi:MAG: hypothetical protein WCB68_24490 [Pyrinomonadaceae bacterium]